MIVYSPGNRCVIAIGIALLVIAQACRAEDRAVTIPTTDGLSLSATLTVPSGTPRCIAPDTPCATRAILAAF